MNYRTYMKRIQSALEKIKAADKIQEGPWQEVVLKELIEISKNCAKELQTEIGQIANKGDYQLGIITSKILQFAPAYHYSNDSHELQPPLVSFFLMGTYYLGQNIFPYKWRRRL